MKRLTIKAEAKATIFLLNRLTEPVVIAVVEETESEAVTVIVLVTALPVGLQAINVSENPALILRVVIGEALSTLL